MNENYQSQTFLYQNLQDRGTSITGGCLTQLVGTSVNGFVFDSTPSAQSANVPVVGLTLRMEGIPGLTAVTDENGFFRLQDTPGGEFFVTFDTSTVASAPVGFNYLAPAKPSHPLPGRDVRLAKEGKEFDIFLPRVDQSKAIDIASGEMTVAQFSDTTLDNLANIRPGVPRSEWEKLKVEIPPDSLFFKDGTPADEVQIFALDPERIPAPLPGGVNPAIVFSIDAGGARDFGTPAKLTFPNIDGLAPGEVRPIYTFDHDGGEWKITGRAVVSADGSVLETDEGGVTTLGWKGIGFALGDILNWLSDLFGGDQPDIEDYKGFRRYLQPNAGASDLIVDILERDYLVLTPVNSEELDLDETYVIKESGLVVEMSEAEVKELIRDLQVDLDATLDYGLFSEQTDFEREFVIPTVDPAVGSVYEISSPLPGTSMDGFFRQKVVLLDQDDLGFTLHTADPITPDGTFSPHPFAGPREFRAEPLGDGSYYIYNRGIARTKNSIIPGFESVASKIGRQNYNYFTQGLKNAVRERGGTVVEEVNRGPRYFNPESGDIADEIPECPLELQRAHAGNLDQGLETPIFAEQLHVAAPTAEQTSEAPSGRVFYEVVTLTASGTTSSTRGSYIGTPPELLLFAPMTCLYHFTTSIRTG